MADTAPRRLVVGASGQVGRCLLRRLGESATGTHLNHPRASGLPTQRMDVRDPDSVVSVFHLVRPSVVHLLAYDMADVHGSIIRGAENVLQTASEHRARVVFLSTDMVFPGSGRAWREEDRAEPMSDYGRAKQRAEDMVLAGGGVVARTSLVYSLDPPDERVESLARGLAAGDWEYAYFTDEYRCPVYVEDLCAGLVALENVDPGVRRVWHVAGPELLSRHELAVALARGLGCDPAAIPFTDLGGLAAKRPSRLELDVSRAMGLPGVRLRRVGEVVSEEVEAVRACRERFFGVEECNA
ncbi:MAG: SDR family oxidoreductase [Desulfatibacillaceae bacterium]